MAKKPKRKRVRPAPPPERRAGEAPTPAFHGRIIVKSAPPVLRKAAGTIKQIDETLRVITFIASEQLVDRDNDLVITRGIDTTNFRRNPIFLADHNVRQPLGKVIDLRVSTIDGHDALTGVAEILPVGTGPLVDGLWREIKAGVRRGVSIGFLAREAEPRMEAGRLVGRVLRAIELLEVSSVTLPSCPGCLVTATSGAKSWCADHEPAALAASVQETLRRGAELLAKLDGEIPYRYIEMLDWNLQAPQRHLAREVLFYASKELGIAPPELRFFTSAADEASADFWDTKMWGYSRKGDHIAIEWTLAPAEMAQVTAHECAHFAGREEEEADAFGRAFAARRAKMLPAPRRSGSWTGDQLLAAASFIRHRGGF